MSIEDIIKANTEAMIANTEAIKESMRLGLLLLQGTTPEVEQKDSPTSQKESKVKKTTKPIEVTPEPEPETTPEPEVEVLPETQESEQEVDLHATEENELLTEVVQDEDCPADKEDLDPIRQTYRDLSLSVKDDAFAKARIKKAFDAIRKDYGIDGEGKSIVNLTKSQVAGFHAAVKALG